MTSRSPWSCILWDVDGTIVDASDGILSRLDRCLTHFGRPAPTRAELVHWIGPPMYESFQKNVGMTPEEATEAVAYYRALGKADGYTARARVYPGVGELIAELAACGIPQATASSKPEIQVVALMDHFGLSEHMQAMAGATPDEKTLASKADIVAESLRRLAAAGVDTSRPILIGDRHHDIDGGAANDVPVIFVRWGFSWPHESEGAQAAVDTVAELRRLLLLEDEV
ncbi:HAD hydrolase-like protein [Microbacterium sp. EYE_5]|uniref:HAD hydrolase-like protein n=1 Tax=unclassified Microbacterium TaxID=2609290 RepID=UPI002006BF71|nr:MULTISPECIES: HAD hydrolase-like protein [unclassified Microbacterium]MCK6079617.1 HAD hydrolase-like protein [Microbacterium sp. EYE_382]MCK6084888.1 HAD hydrolase-like protein [Microbacterium sp. EYE_384]MCK6122886.1 HAD hydrolase-like protein [Microbacterium sp. EYE_80]MCK6125651.1 HAD hydrolase-like protein [Microbacterium sp. EYE_79]MCK6140572.1 HAD hydrolase-like protein [Microbacterium sp. EYE_39]